MDFANEVTLNIVKHDGYVKGNSKYFVTDNLEIFPSSKSLALLQKLNVENMSSLDTIDIRVGTDEVTFAHVLFLIFEIVSALGNAQPLSSPQI